MRFNSAGIVTNVQIIVISNNMKTKRHKTIHINESPN